MKHIKLFEQFVNEAFDRGVHMVVISDSKDGLGTIDPKKPENVINIIYKEIRKRAELLEMDPNGTEINGILDGIKYYEKTDKIVGKMPHFMFLKNPMSTKNNIDRTYFKAAFKERYPNVELFLKKIIK